MNMPELRHLEYLAAIAKEGTFSAAAEALHITQPALTRMMQRLEEERSRLAGRRMRKNSAGIRSADDRPDGAIPPKPDHADDRLMCSRTDIYPDSAPDRAASGDDDLFSFAAGKDTSEWIAERSFPNDRPVPSVAGEGRIVPLLCA